MAEIRTLHVDEFEDFMRYVERAFGHSKGFFERDYPQLYHPTEEACEWAYVVVEDGEILSHVGVYPIESVTAGLPLTIGGIGAVSTAPKARGRGYMTQLLNHVIEEMRRIGYPVSWLSGDRQRYNTFGWESSSPEYTLLFTRRSMAWDPVEPAGVEEVFPEEALETIQRFHSAPACYTHRPYLERQIQKMDLRFWIADDGYAVLRGQERDDLSILELVSESGREINMIQAIMDWNFASRARWPLSIWDKVRMRRVMPYVAYWRTAPSGMYRINDLPAFLHTVKPYLNQQAQALDDFQVTLALKERDRTTHTTLTVEDGEVAIAAGQENEPTLELSPIGAARLMLGGPSAAPTAPKGLQALFPAPAYVMPWDHV